MTIKRVKYQTTPTPNRNGHTNHLFSGTTSCHVLALVSVLAWVLNTTPIVLKPTIGHCALMYFDNIVLIYSADSLLMYSIF